MKQRGFIQLPIMAWAAIGAAVAIGGLSLALWVQTGRLDAVKREYAGFVANVKAQGEAAEAETKRINKENEAKRARYDKQISALRSSNATLERRLRDSASESSLPRTASITGQPQAACFDRPQLDAAIRGFTERTAAIAAEGSRCLTELDNARSWAADLLE